MVTLKAWVFSKWWGPGTPFSGEPAVLFSGVTLRTWKTKHYPPEKRGTPAGGSELGSWFPRFLGAENALFLASVLGSWFPPPHPRKVEVSCLPLRRLKLASCNASVFVAVEGWVSGVWMIRMYLAIYGCIEREEVKLGVIGCVSGG